MKKIKGGSHQNAKASTFQNARYLRDNMTPQETKLWEKLKNKQILGHRFRRQHTIHIYVLDFFCIQCGLSIELDGKHHMDIEYQEYDNTRTEYLNDLGISELRFTNKEIDEKIHFVIEKIEIEINKRFDHGKTKDLNNRSDNL